MTPVATECLSWCFGAIQRLNDASGERLPTQMIKLDCVPQGHRIAARCSLQQGSALVLSGNAKPHFGNSGTVKPITGHIDRHTVFGIFRSRSDCVEQLDYRFDSVAAMVISASESVFSGIVLRKQQQIPIPGIKITKIGFGNGGHSESVMNPGGEKPFAVQAIERIAHRRDARAELVRKGSKIDAMAGGPFT